MLDRLFLEHPRTVGETYPQHMAASLGVASRLFVASLKCVVHAVVPGWCKTSGSDAIVKLHSEIAPRRYDQPTF
ncbi:MAG: DUF6356 family protein [Polymorphobacter sp.]|uniref:DUF6356 family protein n=1 Tax=Polymorphobacter sp. TaxID=1909290 RepID=UPI003A892FEF